jgi:succinoglycan biosynthesis protein ExoM
VPADLISICICTYRRPELLGSLLRALQAEPTGPEFTVEIVVVDNDRERSAEGTVRAFQQQSAIPVTYDCEPEQNIARARNRAVAAARGVLVAFIDDDERPGPEWLLRLYRALREYGADGVLGPVVPEFLSDPPRWIVQGRFFDRPRCPTGTWLPWQMTRSGNALLRRELFEGAEPPFREEYGGGGEDVDFFRRMTARGRRFVWCDEAIAWEAVPPERCRRSYLIRRSLLRGRAPYNQGWAVLKSVVAAPAYALALPVLPLFGHHVFMRYLLKECDHLGRIFALLGVDLVGEKYVTR